MDAAPPEIPQQAPLVYSAADIGPKDARERELCATASGTDWLYLGVLLASDVASVYADSWHFQYATTAPVRLVGPSLVGLTWGATISGAYLSFPKCSGTWIASTPAEGTMRSSWPIGLALAGLAGASAPFLVGVESPYFPPLDWTVTERTMRLVLAGATGLLGSAIPWVLPPKTWRAAKELDHLRLIGDTQGAFVSYGTRF